jgi:hypothetical protein
MTDDCDSRLFWVVQHFGATAAVHFDTYRTAFAYAAGDTNSIYGPYVVGGHYPKWCNTAPEYYRLDTGGLDPILEKQEYASKEEAERHFKVRSHRTRVSRNLRGLRFEECLKLITRKG